MPVFLPEDRYTNRLNQVLNYGHYNHEGNLNLDRLADIACLSKYHFIRIFQDHVGESPVRYLKRTRLERAGSLLKNETQLSVLEIAHRCGFNSAQSFSREFGNWFGFAPRQFRISHLNNLEDCSESGYLRNLFKQFSLIGIDPNLNRSAEGIRIRAVKPTRVAYVRSIGRSDGNRSIVASMESIKNWAQNRGLWSEASEMIGISWDFSSMTPTDMRRYDAAVSIPENLSLSGGVSCQTIPGGLYAIAQVPYQRPADLILIWKWFSMILTSTAKFHLFRPKINTGPWYEVYKQKTENDSYVIELYARLESLY